MGPPADCIKWAQANVYASAPGMALATYDTTNAVTRLASRNC